MSHIVGLSHDVVAATLLTAGCYIFGVVTGVVPFSYTTGLGDAGMLARPKKVSRYLNVPTQLLDLAITTTNTTPLLVSDGFSEGIEE
jgi:hypothetical protein